jgi:hypothetical protein
MADELLRESSEDQQESPSLSEPEAGLKVSHPVLHLHGLYSTFEEVRTFFFFSSYASYMVGRR